MNNNSYSMIDKIENAAKFCITCGTREHVALLEKKKNEWLKKRVCGRSFYSSSNGQQEKNVGDR